MMCLYLEKNWRLQWRHFTEFRNKWERWKCKKHYRS